MTEHHTSATGDVVVDLRAENDRLRGELARTRRELDNARAALDWIDSLQALDALEDLHDLDEAQAAPGTGRLPAPTPARPARRRTRDAGPA